MAFSTYARHSTLPSFTFRLSGLHEFCPVPGQNFPAFYNLPFWKSTTESVKIANTLTAWPQKTRSLPDGVPLLLPAVILSGVAKNTICCPIQEEGFASPHWAPENPFLSLSIESWQQQLFSSHHHAFRKVTVPRVVSLLAIINVAEKEGLPLTLPKGWRDPCCYFVRIKGEKSLQKEMSISWLRNPSRDHFSAFYFWSCFRLGSSFMVALVDIYRSHLAFKHPWGDG